MPRVETVKIVQFLAVVLTAFALVPGGAHLLALPNKIGMNEQAYFTAQQIYRGWAVLGVVFIAAIGANLTLAVFMRLRGQRLPFYLASAAFGLLVASLMIFFVWTYPANQLTGNWTSVPPGWEELRTRWEYSHAANAGATLAAFCCVLLSVLSARDR